MAGLLLGIETSCDETAAAVVAGGRRILSNIISSQVELHQPFGGVVPELASRKHLENISPIVQEAMKAAGVTWEELDGIAVTRGPGLVGALLVGVTVAKAIAFARRLPLVGVNHLEGHIYSNFLAHPWLEPPFLALVVSGGHTDLLQVLDYGRYRLLGQTRDDAAGEAFDKVARVLGLGYPGGPRIEAVAREGNPEAIAFPRAVVKDAPFAFSFSGVKTAVLNYLNRCRQRGETIAVADVAASFQAAVVEVLVERTLAAAAACGVDRVAVCGGVAANSALRSLFQARSAEAGIEVLYPPPVLCTDNAAMIASVGYYRLQAGHTASLDLNAVASLPLASWG
ncbi:MAG TPA: tRNA (adenosine(37)-N6)-threonylcarbamoyltransferase complex transferase subunit TsaD [Firmicutes bacterium]|nr:tRNA (adenosine(37)-N6)-threonylcarbamoyltransferase complex transferase subunit TsaD [Bacillota bacterium]